MTRWWSELKARARALLDRRAMEDELDEELRFHLERETEKLLRQGLGPEEARREAYRRFGGVDRHRDETRNAWGTRWLHDLAQDVRLGLRRMRKAPGFTGIAAVTLALGVGGTVALGSVVHGLLLRPLPYEDADRLRVFWSEYNWRGSEYDHVRGVTDALEIATYTVDGTTLDLGDRNRHLSAGLVSANVFDLLGAEPLLGRTLRPGEDRPGAEPAVVLSHGLWEEELGGAPDVLGRRIVLDGTPTTVVGVMPPGFYFPNPDIRLWKPLDLDPANPVYANNGWLVLIGRLAEGHGEASVPGALDAITTALGERFTYSERWDKTRGAHLTELREYLVGDVRSVVVLLLGAVALLLLMAVVNVSSLLLTRTLDRAGELGLRRALGAGRGRIVRQITTEALLLGGVAGVAGAALAVTAFPALVAALPLDAGLAGTLTLRWDALLPALGLATLGGAATALAPTLRVLRDRRREVGSGSGRGRAGSGSPGASRLQGALVAGQVVMAVVLVTGATLFARSADRLRQVDLGIEPEGVVALGVVLTDASLGPDEIRMGMDRLTERAEALPGITAAGLNLRLPVRDDGVQGGTRIESRPELEGRQLPNAYWRAVTPGYFETMGMSVVRGRGFRAADGPDAVPVAVVNERFAREMWPGEDPLGQRVQGSFDDVWATVVGVVGDVRLTGPRTEVPRVLYRPTAQWDQPWLYRVLVARTDGSTDAALQALRRTVDEATPEMVAVRVTTMDAVVESSMGDILRLRFFLGLLAALALFVGGAGIYGVVGYAVTRRTGEYGVRLALGAARGRLVREVLARSLRPVLAGAALGLVASLFLGRLAAGLLYEIVPQDPMALGAGVLFLLLTGVAAGLVPALRAARVEPARALQAE